MSIDTGRKIPLGAIRIVNYTPDHKHAQNIPKITEGMQEFAAQYGFTGKISVVLEYHQNPQTGKTVLYPLFKIEGLPLELPLYPGDVIKDTRNAWPQAWTYFEHALALEAAVGDYSEVQNPNPIQVELKSRGSDVSGLEPTIAPLIAEVRSYMDEYGLPVVNLKALKIDRVAQGLSTLPKFVVTLGYRGKEVILELPSDPRVYNLAEEGGRKAWQTAFDRLLLQLKHLPPTYVGALKLKLKIGVASDSRARAQDLNL